MKLCEITRLERDEKDADYCAIISFGNNSFRNVIYLALFFTRYFLTRYSELRDF